MDWKLNIFILVLFVLHSVVTFNIDSNPWKHFQENQGTAFGYKVIQKTSRLIISDPLKQNQNFRGTIYNCDVGGSSCSNIKMKEPPEAINMSLGLSMTEASSSSELIVCGPTIPKDCKEFTTYNGMCFIINENLVPSGPIPSTLRDCPPPQKTDIIFLMDGSGSVNSYDFTTMKNFIITLIGGLQDRDFRFAVAQFSTEYQLHIPFRYRPDISQIQRIWQEGQYTYTGMGINRIVDEFRSARIGANKILVVITDGASNDGGNVLKNAANRAQQNNIIRYAIGVGSAFNIPKAERELKIIASDPDEQYVFKVNDFNVLQKIQETLKANIIAIEGTQTGESTKMEFAQDGFNAVITPNRDILWSAVGAFQWQGGYQDNAKGFLKGNGNDSYSGYSMKVAKTRSDTYVILGAPREEHKGKIIISYLHKFESNMTVGSPEPQLGSYYGAEICVVDLNRDKYADLLLVSAPLYIHGDQEGKVFVYKLDPWTLKIEHIQTLIGMPAQRGRFGLTLSSPADLNGDLLTDIVIGAPMEDNGQGSIYIFNGRSEDINPTYSQRISGSSVQTGLQFFGFSLSESAVDHSGDQLPDLAIGSKGTVNIFRTRPIVSLKTTVSYNPSQIPITIADCTPATHTLNLCFKMTGYNKVSGDVAANINYTLKLDAKRQTFRGTFLSNERNLFNTIKVSLDQICQPHDFIIAGCPKDALNPLTTELTFTFDGLPSNLMDGLKPLLSPTSKTTSDHNLDFKTDCGEDNICIDNIQVDFNFSGASVIKVGIMQEMNVTVFLKNRGENSYNTHIKLKYPFGLSFRRFTIKEGRVECTSLDSDIREAQGETTCYINKPIFRKDAVAVFEITYSINKDSNYDRMLFNLTAESDNDEHSKDSKTKKELSIDVKYAIYIALIRHEDTSIHINFTAGRNDLQKPIQQILKVENDLRDLNFTIFIKVPVKIMNKDIWTNQNLEIKGCSKGSDEQPTISDTVAALKQQPEVNCTVAVCSVFQCNAYFKKREIRYYNISGNISSGWIEKTGLRSVVFELVSTATLEYDSKKYIYFSFDSQNTAPIGKINTKVEVYEEKFPLKETIGGIVAGLVLLAVITAVLFKVGFFKSKYNKMLEEAGTDNAGANQE